MIKKLDRNWHQWCNLALWYLFSNCQTKSWIAEMEQRSYSNQYRWQLGSCLYHLFVFIRSMFLIQWGPRLWYVKKYLGYFWMVLNLEILQQSMTHRYHQEQRTCCHLLKKGRKKLYLFTFVSLTTKSDVDLIYLCSSLGRGRGYRQRPYPVHLLWPKLRIWNLCSPQIFLYQILVLSKSYLEFLFL